MISLVSNELSPVNVVKLDDPDLLLPPAKIPYEGENVTDEQERENDKIHMNNYNLFCKAVRIAFDIQPGILMETLINFDLLWMPPLEGEDRVSPINFYHLINLSVSDPEPIMSVFSFLFEDKDPYYGERYQFTKQDKINRTAFYTHIRKTYKNAQEYISRVNEFLYLGVDDNLEYIDAINNKVNW